MTLAGKCFELDKFSTVRDDNFENTIFGKAIK